MAGKRAHGEGYVKQLPSGNWRGQAMDGYTDEGKKKILSFTAATKGEVLTQMREWKSQKEQGLRLDRDITFSEWADTWYESYRTQVEPSTYSSYKFTLKLLKERIGFCKLIDILPMHVGQLITRLMKEGYSKSQTSKCRAMMIQIFDSAESNLLIHHNPARKSKPPKDLSSFGTAPQSKKDAFTPGEVSALFEELSDDLIGHSIRLHILTGMRVQELIALTVDDISPDGSVVDINKAIKMVDGRPKLGPPKSKLSYRRIPVPGEARESACYLREHSRGTFIWSPSKIKPLYSVGSYRTKYYNAIQKIPGVRRLPPHCCRHTYVTALQARGVPMETIARLTGHSKVDTTNSYLHISMDTLEAAVSALDTPTI